MGAGEAWHAVRWEVKDENLDLKSLVVEYQVEGVGVWRRVPIKRPKLIGGQQWDAGTAEAIKVRASVADKAGNVAEAAIELPEGTAGPADLVTTDPGDDGPSRDRYRSPMERKPEIMAGPSFTPVNPRPLRQTETNVGHRAIRPNNSRQHSTSRFDARGAVVRIGLGSRPGVARSRPVGSRRRRSPTQGSLPAGRRRPRGSSALPSGDLTTTNPPAFTQSPVRDGGGGTLLVASPRFKLQYAIDDAGPSGPATVELWITQDGGRTWIRRGDDPDRRLPIEVDLGGEGTYGLCLVARSASGLGDQPPRQGTLLNHGSKWTARLPRSSSSRPRSGPESTPARWRSPGGQAIFICRPGRSSLSWRLDQPGAAWQTIADAQENAGQYVWTVPATVPQRFHLKVEAVDSVGHRGSAETTDMGPIMVDRSRPRSRIIGLDPNARSGTGPSARPLR